MKTFLLLLSVAFCVFTFLASAEEIKIKPVPLEFMPVMNPEWGGDVAITNREPLGRPSGAARSNGTAFVAVPDTGIFPGFALVIYRSTNFGQTWSPTVGITPSFVIHKTKMVRTASDSFYVFFQSGGTLIHWNVETSFLRQFDSTYVRDFDVVTSGSGGMYLFVDFEGNNNIRRYGSTDGGATWPQVGFVTSGGAIPRLGMNSRTPLDTLILTYYGPPKPDTLRSVIRLARYRETAAGALSSAGFIDINTDTTVARGEHGSAKVGGTIWVFNTRGVTGSIDIQARVSTDGGVSYGTAFGVADISTRDEYWFNAQSYAFGGGGVDFVYYSDSIAAVSNNTTDKIIYTSAAIATPTSFRAPVQISQHYPEWSPRGYIPTLVEFYDAGGDVGAIWVGYDAAQKKLYFDRLNAPPVGVSPVSALPAEHSLSQNYPNPFNPATHFEFSVREADGSPALVSLRVYDVLGREVVTLVNEEKAAGRYTVRWDATGVASGIYFYRLTAGSYVNTKKLTILK